MIYGILGGVVLWGLIVLYYNRGWTAILGLAAALVGFGGLIGLNLERMI